MVNNEEICKVTEHTGEQVSDLRTLTAMHEVLKILDERMEDDIGMAVSGDLRSSSNINFISNLRNTIIQHTNSILGTPNIEKCPQCGLDLAWGWVSEDLERWLCTYCDYKSVD